MWEFVQYTRTRRKTYGRINNSGLEYGLQGMYAVARLPSSYSPQKAAKEEKKENDVEMYCTKKKGPVV
jgi:hypothetical protein